MKMKYEKPMVAVDRYELSQSIAGCYVKVGLMNSACFILSDEVPPEWRFSAAVGWFADDQCMTFVMGGTTDNNGWCYHSNANGALVS